MQHKFVEKMNSMLYSEKIRNIYWNCMSIYCNVHVKCIYSDIVYITISALSFNHTSTRNTMVMGWRRSWYADSGVFNTLADTMSELMNWLCRDIFRYLQSKDNIFSRNYNISRCIGGGGIWKPFQRQWEIDKSIYMYWYLVSSSAAVDNMFGIVGNLPV